jgi:hypothetical protein
MVEQPWSVQGGVARTLVAGPLVAGPNVAGPHDVGPAVARGLPIALATRDASPLTTYEYEEEAPEDEAADADEDGRGEATPRRRRRAENASGRISAAAAAEAALRSVVELTGKQPEGVTAVAPTDDGWLVGVEVLEAQHVPSSSDTHRVPS